MKECNFYDLAQFLIDMCDKHKICHCRKSIHTSPKNLALILLPSQDNSPLLQAGGFPQSVHPSLGRRYAQYWASSTLIGCACNYYDGKSAYEPDSEDQGSSGGMGEECLGVRRCLLRWEMDSLVGHRGRLRQDTAAARKSLWPKCEAAGQVPINSASKSESVSKKVRQLGSLPASPPASLPVIETVIQFESQSVSQSVSQAVG